MPHQRQLIREAAVAALLKGARPWGARVEPTRVRKYRKGEPLPALAVYTLTESSELGESSAPRELDRAPLIEIVGWAAVPGDGRDPGGVLDELARHIEAAIDADPYLGGVVSDKGLVLTDTDMDFPQDGDHQYGTFKLTYAATYYTLPGVVEATDEFITAGVTTRIAGASDANAMHDEFAPRETPSTDDDGGGVVITRDASNGLLYPATAAEWDALLASAGLAGAPTSVWNLQEASGPALDSIGGITLTPANWSLWRQPVSGAMRVAMRGVDGLANCKLMNSTTAPNPALTSTLLLMYLDMPAAPAATRFVAVAGQGCDLRYNSAGKLVLQTSAVTPFATALVPGPRWVVLQCNNSARTTKAYTDQEKVVGTYAQPTSAPFIALGGNNGAAGAVSYAYAAQFTGAAAEMPDVQIKRLLQAVGATVLW